MIASKRADREGYRKVHWTARHKAIMSLVEEKGSCSVSELMARLGVSDETVRRDIKALAAKGLVERVHGGLLKPAHVGEGPFVARMRTNAEAKRAIGEMAAREINDGDSLMLDTGSTTAFVARALATHRNLFVVTNSGEIGRILASGKGNRVYVVGGEIRGDDGAVFGESAIEFLSRFRVHLAVLSAGGIHPDTGLMDYHLPEAEIARAMASCANQTVVVADHTKFQTQAPVAALGLERLDAVITDTPPPPEAVGALERNGVRLVVAPPRQKPAELAVSRV
jgi:DeoR family transcriptional regulator, glycerol-3-phosphate regulon repressor